MPISIPPIEALREFLGATTRHTRRVEIYEQDGLTRWSKDTEPRLKTGGVSVDYDRDERRGLDLTLTNYDGVLINAPGEFWYDKVIKAYRGVQINAPVRQPRVLVISDETVEIDVQAPSFRAALMSQDYGDVQVNTLATDYDVDIAPFDIIVSLGNQDNGALLLEAYNAGKSIFVFRTGAEYFYNALTGGTSWGTANQYISGTSTEERRNRVLNPRPTSTTGWNTSAGTAGVVTPTYSASGGFGPASGGYNRLTFTTAPTAAFYGWRVDGRAASAQPIPVVVGTTYTGSIYVRNSIAQSMQCRLYWFDAAGVQIGSPSNGDTVAVAATTPTRLSVTAAAPVGATHVMLAAYTVAAPLAAIGTTMDACQALLETGSDLQAFFDGNISPVGNTVYSWSGTVNASTSGQYTYTSTGMMTPESVNDPRTVGWPEFQAVASAALYKAPLVTLPGIFGVALQPGSTTLWSITSGENTVGGKFVAVHYPLTSYQHANSEFRLFLKAVTDWLNPVVPLAHWEVQVGEFMIDRISEPHFPHEVKITGRDYTKKCMLSKFSQATAFAAGHSLESVIAAISTGAGITKRLLPATGIVIGREFFFERNTTRWEAMKEICTAYNYEIYFDPSGYLTIRPFRDPSTTAPVIYIETGPEGTAASYEKSTSDASIFNFVLVSGENSDAATPLVWAEAKNEDADSPTSIQELGERYWEFVSAFVETEQQAQDLADGYLGVHQLEEYELSWESLMLPWLEVGEVMGWVDPNPAPDDPTTFLLSSLTIPLDLGPMSGTGRRVIIVQTPQLTETELAISSTTTWDALPDDVTWNELPDMTWNEI